MGRDQHIITATIGEQSQYLMATTKAYFLLAETFDRPLRPVTVARYVSTWK